MLIDCTKAAEICNKAQYQEAGSWKVFKLKIHLMYCTTCRKHASKNGKLTKLCSKAKLQCMDPERKQEIKEKIASRS